MKPNRVLQRVNPGSRFERSTLGLLAVTLFAVTLLVTISGAAKGDEPGVRLALTDEPVAASAMRAAPAVRVAALIDKITSRSEARSSAVPVFREEAEFNRESGPHHAAWLSNRHGYQPACCDDESYTDGLWSGYCETRRTHWMQGTWFMRTFYGKDCCDTCESGKSSKVKSSSKSIAKSRR